MKKRKKSGGIEAIKRRYGYCFVAPWVFGVVVFVLIPVLTSFYYSLSNVVMSPEGLKASFVGLKNYEYVFFENPDYANQILESFSALFTSMPIVVALSMILAIILNQKFKGRMLARAVFFLPVIIASSAVMSILAGGFSMNQEIAASSGISSVSANTEYMKVIDFTELLQRLDLPANVNSLIGYYLQNTFNLIWNCGVQILLFVAGLQTIPAQLYEAGKVEGITAWEEFWYITVPMMGRVIMLVIFYTMVQLFITKGTLVNSAIDLIKKQDYAQSSAMLWPYFAIVGIVIGMVIFLYNKFCLKRWE